LFDSQILAYTFVTFVVGIGCLGAAMVLARSREDGFARGFLGFYLPLSVLVLGALLLASTETRTAPSARTVFIVEYLEAFIGRYGTMLGLLLFAHSAFGTRGRARNTVLLGIVVAAFMAQHITEFALGGQWDARGDVAEDLLFAAVVAYTIWLGFTTLNHPATSRFLARRFLALLLIGVPAAGHDLFLVDGPGLRLYPLWYCAMGVTMVFALVARRSTSGAGIPAVWELSPREEEIVRLVQRGLSNRDIARELTISPNTVKTHLRAIFDKSGFRTRVALIATLAAPSGAANGFSAANVTRPLES
jgi:DNA-binding CsgD family transcriptional regulator